MTVTPEQQKKILVGLVACLAILVAYRITTGEKPRTAPLVYNRGAVATSSVRGGIGASGSSANSLQLFLAERERKFPGVSRDLFRMENPRPPQVQHIAKTAPTPTVPPPPPPPTPEEIAAAAARAAADAARADLSKFRFMGYLDNSLFLSKDGQVYVVKSGDPVTGTYRVHAAGNNYVILRDTVTGAEVRIELSGGEAPPARR